MQQQDRKAFLVREAKPAPLSSLTHPASLFLSLLHFPFSLVAKKVLSCHKLTFQLNFSAPPRLLKHIKIIIPILSIYLFQTQCIPATKHLAEFKSLATNPQGSTLPSLTSMHNRRNCSTEERGNLLEATQQARSRAKSRRQLCSLPSRTGRCFSISTEQTDIPVISVNKEGPLRAAACCHVFPCCQ